MARTTSQFRSWDDYYIPGTTVLRNKFVTPTEPHGITDPDILRRYEERATLIRMTELAQHPVDGAFDYDHLKAIHKALFQDVYEWAGQERTGPNQQMTKSGPDVVNFAPGDPYAPTVNYGYYPAHSIAEAANTQFRRLAAADLLRGCGREEFLAGLAEHWGEINTIHSFREGNTRTQFVFFSELSKQAGYELDIAQFAESAPLRQEFVEARFHNQATTGTDRLIAVLDKAVTEIAPPTKAAQGFTTEYQELMSMVAQQRQQPQRNQGFEFGD